MREFIHPEQGPDEQFDGNYSRPVFENLPYKTKRMGKEAIDVIRRQPPTLAPGEKMNLFPVFISREEARERGIRPHLDVRSVSAYHLEQQQPFEWAPET